MQSVSLCPPYIGSRPASSQIGLSRALVVFVPAKGWVEVAGALQINMQEKPDGVHPKMEKYLLRKAFDRPDSPYLPESVLWRQKEQFSDGVGYDWVDRLKEYSHEVTG